MHPTQTPLENLFSVEHWLAPLNEKSKFTLTPKTLHYLNCSSMSFSTKETFFPHSQTLSSWKEKLYPGVSRWQTTHCKSLRPFKIACMCFITLIFLYVNLSVTLSGSTTKSNQLWQHFTSRGLGIVNRKLASPVSTLDSPHFVFLLSLLLHYVWILFLSGYFLFYLTYHPVHNTSLWL